MSPTEPLCLRCRHFDEDAPVSAPRCKAYPEGIPSMIWLGQVEHKEPLPEDQGIQFEEVKA